MNFYWELDPEKSGEYHASFSDAEMGDPQSRWWRATVKWDGCIHLDRYYNLPEDVQMSNPNDPYGDKDYIHICNLDAYIKRLQELRDRAQGYFRVIRGDWPG